MLAPLLLPLPLLPLLIRRLIVFASKDGIARLEDVKLNLIQVGVVTLLVPDRVLSKFRLADTIICIDHLLGGMYLPGGVRQKLTQALEEAIDFKVMCQAARALARRSQKSRDEDIDYLKSLIVIKPKAAGLEDNSEEALGGNDSGDGEGLQDTDEALDGGEGECSEEAVDGECSDEEALGDGEGDDCLGDAQETLDESEGSGYMEALDGGEVGGCLEDAHETLDDGEGNDYTKALDGGEVDGCLEDALEALSDDKGGGCLEDAQVTLDNSEGDHGKHLQDTTCENDTNQFRDIRDFLVRKRDDDEVTQGSKL